jgi:hypothetical protein
MSLDLTITTPIRSPSLMAPLASIGFHVVKDDNVLHIM